MSDSAVDPSSLHIDVNNLSYAYPGKEPCLKNFNMQLQSGARCLLVGANGAGKSTLLRILAGRHLSKPDDSVKLLGGRSAFHDTRLNFERAYLDTDWGMRAVAFAGYGCPLQADIAVSGMMSALQAQFPERRDILIKLLGIDMKWRMHQVSDGQRRRVQIFLGLLRPYKILLLDEVTVSLDVVVRVDLLQWLKSESEERGATILYATHIFDGLDDWPTHVHYIRPTGVTGWQGEIQELPLYQEIVQYNINNAGTMAQNLPQAPAVTQPNFLSLPRNSAGTKQHTQHPCAGWVYSPLLRIAETWLRSELLYANRRDIHIDFGTGKIAEIEAPAEGEANTITNGNGEEPMGEAAFRENDPTQKPYNSGGGFSSGRMAGYDYKC